MKKKVFHPHTCTINREQQALHLSEGKFVEVSNAMSVDKGIVF